MKKLTLYFASFSTYLSFSLLPLYLLHLNFAPPPTAFVIISKTKGWWVVHRDVSLLAPETARKSAWVPAGCLLETSVAPLSLIPGGGSTTGGNAANVPIEPVYVVSVSTPGVALMDYTKSGSDELDVKKGMGLRILKRYNHC